MTTEAETGMMWPQATECWRPPEARALEHTTPARQSTALPTPGFWLKDTDFRMLSPEQTEEIPIVFKSLSL